MWHLSLGHRACGAEVNNILIWLIEGRHYPVQCVGVARSHLMLRGGGGKQVYLQTKSSEELGRKTSTISPSLTIKPHSTVGCWLLMRAACTPKPRLYLCGWQLWLDKWNQPELPRPWRTPKRQALHFWECPCLLFLSYSFWLVHRRLGCCLREVWI